MQPGRAARACGAIVPWNSGCPSRLHRATTPPESPPVTCDADDRHHAVVFVLRDVAVIDEVADIESPEVRARLDAREGMARVTVPEWHLP